MATITTFPNLDALIGYLDDVAPTLTHALLLTIARDGTASIGIAGMTPEEAVDLLEQSAAGFAPETGDRNGTDAEDGTP